MTLVNIALAYTSNIPADKEWMKVGDMPVRRSRLTCVVLSSGELLVSGGRNEHDVYSNEVYKFDV